MVFSVKTVIIYRHIYIIYHIITVNIVSAPVMPIKRTRITKHDFFQTFPSELPPVACTFEGDSSSVNDESVRNQVVSTVLSMRHVLCLGLPGTGKTHLVRRVVDHISEHNTQVRVPDRIKTIFIGPTWQSAKNLSPEGCVIYGSLRVSPEDMRHDSVVIRKCLKMLDGDGISAVHWILSPLLMIVVDEIAMFTSDLTKYLDIVKTIRMHKHVGGRVWLFGLGDPNQLLPIDGERCILADRRFATSTQMYILRTIHRQAANDPLRACFTAAVHGKLHDNVNRIMRVCSPSQMSESDQQLSVICVTRAQRDAFNKKRSEHFRRVNIESAERTGDYSNRDIAYMYKRHKYKSVGMMLNGTHINDANKYSCTGLFNKYKISLTVELCKGDRVAYTINNYSRSPNYFNNMEGTIIAITDDTVTVLDDLSGGHVYMQYKPYTFGWGRYQSKIKMMPLRLAYAHTLHAAQGMTLRGRCLFILDGLARQPDSFKSNFFATLCSRPSSSDGIYVSTKVEPSMIVHCKKAATFLSQVSRTYFMNICRHKEKLATDLNAPFAPLSLHEQRMLDQKDAAHKEKRMRMKPPAKRNIPTGAKKANRVTHSKRLTFSKRIPETQSKTTFKTAFDKMFAATKKK